MSVVEEVETYIRENLIPSTVVVNQVDFHQQGWNSIFGRFGEIEFATNDTESQQAGITRITASVSPTVQVVAYQESDVLWKQEVPLSEIVKG